MALGGVAAWIYNAEASTFTCTGTSCDLTDPDDFKDCCRPGGNTKTNVSSVLEKIKIKIKMFSCLPYYLICFCPFQRRPPQTHEAPTCTLNPPARCLPQIGTQAVVTISTSLTLGNVELADAQSEAGKAAFASAVASTITGVSAANIKNIIVVDANARRRLRDAYQAVVDAATRRRRLAATTVTVGSTFASGC